LGEISQSTNRKNGVEELSFIHEKSFCEMIEANPDLN
jgi:hypothetical protein